MWKFEGDFKNDEADGIGAYSLKNRAKCEGGFKDDKANGKGNYYYEDGDKYEDYFKDGKVVYWNEIILFIIKYFIFILLNIFYRYIFIIF